MTGALLGNLLEHDVGHLRSRKTDTDAVEEEHCGDSPPGAVCRSDESETGETERFEGQTDTDQAQRRDLRRHSEARTTGDEAADGNGNQREPCLECAVPERELKPEGKHRNDSELTEPDDQRRDVAVAERRDGEQPYVHQRPRRIVAAGEHGLPVGERTERQNGENQRHQNRRRSAGPRQAEQIEGFLRRQPPIRTSLDEAEGEQAQAGDGQCRSGGVDAPSGAG